MVQVKVCLFPGCEDLMPAKAHFDDAAFDLRSRVDMVLPVRKSVLVPAGFSLELPVGFEAQIRPRSGLAAKHHITVPNSPGTVDANYRGEVKAILYNLGKEPFTIKRGDRIAQMVIAKLPEVELVCVESLSETGRGEGGFGSTGKA